MAVFHSFIEFSLRFHSSKSTNLSQALLVKKNFLAFTYCLSIKNEKVKIYFHIPKSSEEQVYKEILFTVFLKAEHQKHGQ